MSVTVYSVEGCPFCDKAMAFLEEKGIEFRKVPAPPGSAAWQEMKQRTGSGAVPQVLVNEVPVGGYADLVNLETSGRLYEMLGETGRKSDTPLYDVIILGAGPAGLSAAIYAIRKVMKTLIISKDVGGQVTWTADVDNYLGFSQVNAAELVAKFEDHVKRFGVEKVIGRSVTAVDPTGRVKRVITDDGGTFYGKTLIIATGGSHKLLNVPGERELQGKGVSYCSTCDAPLYDEADVAVIGGGNSALEAVIDLINIARRIYVVSISPLMGDPPYLDKVEASDKVTVFSQHQPVRILGESFVEGIEFKSLITGQMKTMNVEGVFVEIGTMPNSSLFIDDIATNRKGEILVDLECRTGVAGVFACGDVTNVPFKQVVVAVGDGAKAALSAYSYLINQK